MSFSGVADFARNFAVMVRVQGPDPKGLKMRNHAFHHYNSGKTTLSASGILFSGSFPRASADSGDSKEPSRSFLVFTVASVVEPFLVQKYRDNTDGASLISDVQIDVLVDDSCREPNVESLSWLSADLLKIVDIPQSSSAVQTLIEGSCVSPENGWDVGWSLASHSRSQHITSDSRAQDEDSFWNQWNMSGINSSSPNLVGKLATRVAILSIPYQQSMNSAKLRTSVPKRGDLLLAMGSPFGILSPVHFFNNISVGSVGNSYPPSSTEMSILIADIRCLPGMEGCPIFDEHARFIGLLTRPLRQRISGTEIQLVIPWEAIASSCTDLLQEKAYFTKKVEDYDSDAQLPSPIEKAMSSICLITTNDGSWASGILLNKHGLVLTNAHLLEPWRFGKAAASGERNATRLETFVAFYGDNSVSNLLPKSLEAGDISPIHESALSSSISVSTSQRGIRVRVDFVDPWLWTDARVVYISRGPLDVALLQIENAPDQLCPIAADFSIPSLGSKAYVIGHGLFGPRCDSLPSACLGVIAKVIEAKRVLKHGTDKPYLHEHIPAMLETTATVLPGSSGGAVVNSDGCMIGLVTSNAKHGGGTVIPHLNFSIPCAALRPIFKFCQDMQDFSILKELDKPNDHLSSVWALMPPLYPKPEPLFPDLKSPPIEDHNKEIKGSRFSKFIAGRNKFLKNSSLHGTTTSVSNKLTSSKL